MLSFKDLNIKPLGIIHIGAHLGEEKSEYGDVPVIWVEGNPRIIGRLKENVGNDKVISAALSNIVKTTTFNISTNSGSSSLQEFNTHRFRYPNIDVKHKIITLTKPFASIIKENKIDMMRYNFLVISAGGHELQVIQGFDRYLKFIDGIFTKVYSEEVYEDGNNLDTITHYLKLRGYSLSIMKMGDKGWGKACYLRSLK
jgi:FkbM family methyltransferase